MSLRILLRVSRASSRVGDSFRDELDADWPWLASDFFMFSSWEEKIISRCVRRLGRPAEPQQQTYDAKVVASENAIAHR